MNINRTEKLAFILFFLAALVAIVFVITGLQKPELVLAGRRSTYCFQGYVKYLFCTSVLLVLASLPYVLFVGKRFRKPENRKLVMGKVTSFALLTCFFLPLIGIVGSMVAASYSCG